MSLGTKGATLAGKLGERLLARRVARYGEFLEPAVPTRDQAFGLPESVSSSPVDPLGAMEIPSGGVVLLDVQLHGEGFGGLRDPYVELSSPSGECVRQYLERGIAARRWLNVSALAGQTNVTLRTRDVVADLASARFIVAPPVEVEDPLLVLAPHPDDAELAAFGLYAGRPGAWVVTASAGELGTHSYGGLFEGGVAGTRLRGRLRVAESLAAPVAGGTDPARTGNLGYFDGTLATMCRDRTGFARSDAADLADLEAFRRVPAGLRARGPASWETLVEDVTDLLRVSGAKTFCFPHPLLDHHPDHAALGLAALEALQRVDTLPERLLTFAVHVAGGRNGANLHPVGDRDGAVSLPPMDTHEVLFDGLCSRSLDAATLASKALALDTYRDLKSDEGPLPPERAQLRIKRGLREVYRAMFTYDAGLLRRFLRPNELFYVLDPARVPHWAERATAALRSQPSD